MWVAPEYAEWTPKTDVLSLGDLREWMKNADIEVLGFVDSMLHDGRFRIEPPLAPTEYVEWVKLYYGRCLKENPDGEWSDSSYSAGWDIVRIFIKLWDDERVPRELLLDLKSWLADLYRNADARLRTCLITATLEHLFERAPIRKFFVDWRRDSILRTAYQQACMWDIKTPLSE